MREEDGVFNPTALRKAKTPYFGHSECNRVQGVYVHNKNDGEFH